MPPPKPVSTFGQPEDYPNSSTPPNLEDRNKETEITSTKPVGLEGTSSTTDKQINLGKKYNSNY